MSNLPLLFVRKFFTSSSVIWGLSPRGSLCALITLTIFLIILCTSKSPVLLCLLDARLVGSRVLCQLVQAGMSCQRLHEYCFGLPIVPISLTDLCLTE